MMLTLYNRRGINPMIKKIIEIDIGTVLSSFIEASISTIFPLFR
ncbi:MAG: hypothetical protein WBH40_09755 [Ignavibacteriaceae bacterium]